VDIADETRSLSNFKQNTSELVARLKKTRNPVVLTINGKAEVVIQAIEAYQALLDRVETIEGPRRREGWAHEASASSVQPTPAQAWCTVLSSR